MNEQSDNIELYEDQRTKWENLLTAVIGPVDDEFSPDEELSMDANGTA